MCDRHPLRKFRYVFGSSCSLECEHAHSAELAFACKAQSNPATPAHPLTAARILNRVVCNFHGMLQALEVSQVELQQEREELESKLRDHRKVRHCNRTKSGHGSLDWLFTRQPRPWVFSGIFPPTNSCKRSLTCVVL